MKSRTPCDNYENHETLRNQCENHENHEKNRNL